MTAATLTLAEFLLARIAEDEAVARSASGNTVVGERGAWRPSPTGDEWEATNSGIETELLVALRPGLPRPPDAMGGYWGQVVELNVGDQGEKDYDAERLPIAQHIARHDPARVLAECAAKRRIVELHTDGNDPDCTPWGRPPDDREPCDTLRVLASVYADHADYRAEWSA